MLSLRWWSCFWIFFKLKKCTWSYFSQVVRDKKGTAWRKVCTHSLQFCAVPQRGNCCWGCRDDAKMMQDNDALLVYFLCLSAFLPTLCHLALFYPEFVHHRIFGSSHHRICASSESLHQTHIQWCNLWICASSYHRSAEPGIVPARGSI